MSLTPPKKSILKTSGISTAAKSIQNTPMRASGFTNVREIPLDPKSHYTISYIPGMVEHDIETGKTFEEAKMKIVLLTCELERVNTFNYSLVRENEVLRVQANKSDREKDLETKLAIVLAENEKLNQVIEEVYEVYMSQRGLNSNEEYERRIAELYEDLDDWKQRYNVLENQGNVVQLQNAVSELQNHTDNLTEQVARKDRDLEAMRARLAALEADGSLSNRSSDNTALATENAVLRRELETLKLKYGKADGLQLKLNDYDNKVRTILGENEKLNDLLSSKVEEIKDLRAKLDEANSKPVEYSTYAHAGPVERQKKAVAATAPQDNEANFRVQGLIKENDELRQQLEYLKSQVGNAQEFAEKLHVIMDENERLVALLHEKDRELNILREGSNSSRESQLTVDRLSDKLRQVLDENEKLHKLLEDTNKTVRDAVEENRRLKEALDKKNAETNDLYLRLSESNRDSELVKDLKQKIKLITGENERLNNLVDGKLRDLDAINRRLAQAEDALKEKQKEVDSLKYKAYETQNNSALISDLQTKFALVCSENERLNREVETLRLKIRDDKTAELQQQVNFLVSEKYQLEALLRDKEREGKDQENMRNSHIRTFESNLNDLKGQNEQLKNAGVDQKKRIGDLEGRIAQLLTLESRVAILNGETDQLQKVLKDKETQIQMLSQRLADREREAEELRKRLNNADSQRILEIEDVKNRLQAEQEKKNAALKAEMEAELRKLIQEKREVEEKAIFVSIEFERLQTLIQNIKSELEGWKHRCAELEEEKANNVEVEQLLRQFEALKAMNLQVKDLQQKFSAERSAYETQILQLGQMVQDMEYQVQMLTAENQRLTALSVQRLSFIEELKSNSNEEALKLEVYELRSELERVKASSYDVKQMAIQFNTERAADKSKINELQQINASYKADIEKLQSLLEQRKNDIESINRQNEDLRRICEKLNQQNRSSIASSNAEAVEILQTRVNDLEKSRNEYQRQAERNAIDLTRKNRELVDKIQELDVIKLKYEEALANYQALNNEVFTRLSVGKRF